VKVFLVHFQPSKEKKKEKGKNSILKNIKKGGVKISGKIFTFGVRPFQPIKKNLFSHSIYGRISRSGIMQDYPNYHER